jgi:hypothetical protein
LERVYTQTTIVPSYQRMCTVADLWRYARAMSFGRALKKDRRVVQGSRETYAMMLEALHLRSETVPSQMTLRYFTLVITAGTSPVGAHERKIKITMSNLLMKRQEEQMGTHCRVFKRTTKRSGETGNAERGEHPAQRNAGNRSHPYALLVLSLHRRRTPKARARPRGGLTEMQRMRHCVCLQRAVSAATRSVPNFGRCAPCRAIVRTGFDQAGGIGKWT